MIIEGHPTTWRCHDCKGRMAVDFMTLFDYGNHDIDYICDPCRDKIEATFERGVPAFKPTSDDAIAFAGTVVMLLAMLGLIAILQ